MRGHPDGHHHHRHGHAGHAHVAGEPPRPQRARGAERRGLLRALATTAVILIAEVVGGILSNSLALLADAGHMFSDVLALLLAYAALTLASRPATPRRTYGWHRLEILAALVNGVALVVISLGIVWESWERFAEPPVVDTPVMMVVAVIGLAANAAGLVFLQGHHHSLNLRGAYLHVLGDLLSSVGVVVGGAAMWLTGAMWIDPLVSVLIAVVIVFGAWQLLRESVDVLLEAAPAGIDCEAVAAEICAVDAVVGVHDLHVWSLTSGMPALSCHVEVRADHLDHLEDLLDHVRKLLADRFGIAHTTIQIEPEDYRLRQPVHWRLPESDDVA